jgi:hypothetical protein
MKYERFCYWVCVKTIFLPFATCFNCSLVTKNVILQVDRQNLIRNFSEENTPKKKKELFPALNANGFQKTVNFIENKISMNKKLGLRKKYLLSNSKAMEKIHRKYKQEINQSF